MSSVVGTARRPTNITLPSDLITDCRRYGINMSQVCEASLREHLRKERERRWQDEHATFIAEFNELVEQEGLPLAQFRAF